MNEKTRRHARRVRPGLIRMLRKLEAAQKDLAGDGICDYRIEQAVTDVRRTVRQLGYLVSGVDPEYDAALGKFRAWMDGDGGKPAGEPGREAVAG